LLLHASPEQLRAGWFVESVLSASLVVLVIRANGPFLGFSPLPPLFLVLLGGILALYMLTAEVAKHFFYRRMRLS